MAERDRFELDLAAALRAYLEEAPTEVRPTELAGHFATAYPHGTTTFGPWRFAAIPRLAWALLLAGLLAALVGGALLVGSQQRRLPAVVPPVGQVFECPPGSTPDEPGPVDQARPTDGGPAVAFDRRAGVLVALAATAVEGVLETWTFDVCTNTWTRMHPDGEPPFMNQLVYDVDSDLMIASDGTRMWAYDLDLNTWTEKGPFAPFVHPFLASLRFYDPVSGRVVALAKVGDAGTGTLGLELWGYEVETDAWTPIPVATQLVIGPHDGWSESFAYDNSVDRLVAYSRTSEAAGTWLLDLRTGTWSETGASRPPLFDGGVFGGAMAAIAYDEAAERTVMLGRSEAAACNSAAYDATTARWETLYLAAASEDTRPECRHGRQMVYDPVNARLVVFGGYVPTPDGIGGSDLDDVLAYDTRTRQWTVLLEPGAGRATP